MGKTGIKIPNMSKANARNIVKTFSKERIYLESLINEYVPENTRSSVNDMDYSQLLHYGYVISGVAQKILNERASKSKLEQLSIFR